MAMDKNQMEKERELFAAVRQQQAMDQLRQMQLGQSMQEPQAPAQAASPDTGLAATASPATGQMDGMPTQQTGGGVNLSDFHEQATQTALAMLGYMNHLIPRNDLGEPVKADAIHTVAQAIAQLIGLQNQQIDIAPQDKLALEQQKMAAEHQLKQQDMAHQHQLDQAKLQMEAQKAQQQMQLEAGKAQMEAQMQQQNHQQQIQHQESDHQFNQKLQTAKLAIAKEQSDKAAQQKQNKPAPK